MTGGVASDPTPIGPMDVLAFWRAAGPDKWFEKNAAFDSEITGRFFSLWHAAGEGMAQHWEETPEGALALGVVLAGTTALATALAILHGGHTWHGLVLFAPLLVFAIAKRRPLVAQIVLAVFVVFMWHAAFDYGLFRLLEELIRFFEYDGKFNKPGFCI